jgi:hypothetical protein
MLVPRSTDVVDTIARALDTTIAPAVSTTHQRSTLTTIDHMLRYLALCLREEGQVLFDEAERLKTLMARLGKAGGAPGLPDAIGAAAGEMASLAAVRRDPAIYPSRERLATEIREGTECVDRMLREIHAIASKDRSEAVRSLHAEIRDYIAWQLENEARLIEPAFVGRGARR